jgi:Tripartite tricarboxylate transporter TctB family
MGSRVDIPDLAFAVFLVALGGLAFHLAGELQIGRAGAMGPGYVPRGLALIVMLMGVGLGMRALLAPRRPFPKVALRPLLLIGAAVALFALLLPRAGLALTSVAVVLCSGFAATDVKLGENAALAAGLSYFVVVLFVLGLGLPLRIWPW